MSPKLKRYSKKMDQKSIKNVAILVPAKIDFNPKTNDQR